MTFLDVGIKHETSFPFYCLTSSDFSFKSEQESYFSEKFLKKQEALIVGCPMSREPGTSK